MRCYADSDIPFNNELNDYLDSQWPSGWRGDETPEEEAAFHASKEPDPDWMGGCNE